MEESKDAFVNVDVLFQMRRKRRKIFGKGEYLFLEEKKNREGKGGKYLWKISPKIVKDIEKSWFRFRSRSRSRDFCQFLEGYGIGFGEFGLGKKSWFRFWKICYWKKSLGIG